MDIIAQYIEKFSFISKISREEILERIKLKKEKNRWLSDVGVLYKIEKEFDPDHGVIEGEEFFGELTPEGEDRFPYFLAFTKAKFEILKVLAQEKELTFSQLEKIIKKKYNLSAEQVSVEQYLEEFKIRNLIHEKIMNDQKLYRYNLENKHAKSLRDNVILEIDRAAEGFYKFGIDKFRGDLYFLEDNTVGQIPCSLFDKMCESVRNYNCADIYCYKGGLFLMYNVVVVGSRTIPEAMGIFLRNIIFRINNPSDDGFICHLWEKTFPNKKLRDYLLEDITENTRKGWIDDYLDENSLSVRLKKHLKMYKKYGDKILYPYEYYGNDYEYPYDDYANDYEDEDEIFGPNHYDIKMFEETFSETPYTDEELVDIERELNEGKYITKPIDMVKDERKEFDDVELLKFLSKKGLYSYFYDDKIEEKIKNDDLNYATPVSQIQEGNTYLIKAMIASNAESLLIQKICIRCFKNIDDCNCLDKQIIKEILVIYLWIETGAVTGVFLDSVAERLIEANIESIKKIKDTPAIQYFIDKINAELLGKQLYIKGKVEFWDFLKKFIILIKDFKDFDIDKELEERMEELKKELNNKDC